MNTPPKKLTFRYHPFFCEENIWHLCQSPHIQPTLAFVFLVSNPARNCRLWFQRVAPHGKPVFWDYHVFLIARSSNLDAWKVWDLDTLLPIPSPVGSYFHATYNLQDAFWAVPKELRPVFRVIPATEYIQQFTSDRGHMKDTEGNYVTPPPPWPLIRPPGNSTTLAELLEFSLAPSETVMGVSGVLERFGELD